MVDPRLTADYPRKGVAVIPDIPRPDIPIFAGGNKVHAAAHLGISRSTLQLRIRALGISN